jgi:uncharacterized protein (TIGR00251 family)
MRFVRRALGFYSGAFRDPPRFSGLEFRTARVKRASMALPRDSSPASELPFALERQGVRLIVRLTTRADRNALVGVIQDTAGRPALQVRLTAPPVEGAANQALIEFLADSLGLRKADIRIRSGATARVKCLHLSGDSTVIAARLVEWIAACS